MKRFVIAIAVLLGLTSCYPDYVMDYAYSGAYAAYQYDLRTFVCGEDVEVSFTTALGGVLVNDRNRKVNVEIDNSILTSDLSVFDSSHQSSPFTALDGLLGKAPIGTVSQDYVSDEVKAAGITDLTPLPEAFYTTSGPVTIKKGYHTGDLFLYPTDEMFSDEKILKPYYALGFVIKAADVDSVLLHKSFQIMAIKVENRFWGNWYHGGRQVVVNNGDGSVESDKYYQLTFPQADARIYKLTTESFNSVLTDKLSDATGSLRLTFSEVNNEVLVEDASGSKEIRPILGQPSHHNGAKLIQDREIYLNYAYTDGTGTTTYVTDTLKFRNRIRDGINEWQDENSENYN